MQESAARLELLDKLVSDGVRRGIGQRTAEDRVLDGRSVRIDGRDLLHFGSCSYLGLELDPRLCDGAIDAVRRFGTELSSSRVYLSAPPYRELEELLEAIFEAPVVIAPTTTLAHLSAIPTLVDERDAVVLDHQVHHSVQMAVQQVRAIGTHVELVRHSRMDLLEERIRELSTKHRHVWYMADGVYSMFGDFAPVRALERLLERYEQFRLYLDDAHGMSWLGRHGRGMVLSRIQLHPHMVLATGLAKGFGTGGGVLVLPDAEQRRRISVCGGPMLFSGPLQPAVLGAAVASARIHLSPEIVALQAQLRERVDYCNELLSDFELPVLSAAQSPIYFIGMGLPKTAQSMTACLMKEGFFTNLAQFPAVPARRSGLRFMLTRHNRARDIESLIEAIRSRYEDVLAEEAASPESVWEAFGQAPAEGVPSTARRVRNRARLSTPTTLRLERSDSIERIPRDDWNAYLGTRGGFDWDGLRFLESFFRGRGEPENDWQFHYYRVLDGRGRTRLATFFSSALWKSDMLAAASVSRLLEKRRETDPYLLTSPTFSMGSLLTEGNHLYLDPETRAEGSQTWRELLQLLLSGIRQDAAACGAQTLVLRDLPADDEEMDLFLRETGFAKLPMPESMLTEIDWDDEEGFLARLSKKSRRHQRYQVRPWNDTYTLEVLRAGTRRPDAEELAHFHALYRSVKRRGYALNTFDLPRDIFAKMLEFPGWELLTLRLREPVCGEELHASPVVGVVASFVGSEQYVPTLIGLDYRYVSTHGLYRQCLRHILKRAEELGCKRVFYGMSATREKRRFGARACRSAFYVQAEDTYVFDALAHVGATPPV